MMKFNHLNIPNHWEHYWTRFPEGYTILEALISWVSQVDDMVDNQNALSSKVSDFREELDEFVERFDPRLQEEVVRTLGEWQASGFLEIVITEALQTQMDILDQQVGVSVWKYDHLISNKNTAENSNEWDWTEAIKATIQDAFESGLSVVNFPHYGTGDYLTDPISFEGYEGITLKGIGSLIDLNVNYRWGDEDKPTKHVRLKIKSEGEVGLQFSDTSDPAPKWNAPQCKVENIWVYGNDFVDVCINGNFGLTLKNIQASGAIKDGVRFEDYAFPALIEDSQLGPNGRHGFYSRGPMSTVFTLRRVNASLNSGYGYLIEGGSGVNSDDCLAQDNTQGGLKISRRNDRYGQLTSNWLNNLIFNNFYSERNGKLPINDPYYEGNYALVVEGIGNVNVRGQTEPRNITFNGGALNAIAEGGTYNIRRVHGLVFNDTSVDHTKGTVNSAESSGLQVSTVPTKSYSTAPYPFIHKYLEKDRNTTVTVSNGGEIGSRGRIHAIPFKITGLTAGIEVEMQLAYFDDVGVGYFHHGYPIRKGSVVGVKIMTRSGIGTVTAIVTKGSIAGKLVGQVRWIMDALKHDTTTLESEKWFTPLQYTLTNESVGLRVKTSSDYVNQSPSLLAYLIVEE